MENSDFGVEIAPGVRYTFNAGFRIHNQQQRQATTTTEKQKAVPDWANMKTHTGRSCKATFEEIHRQWGNGWKFLGDDLKRAIIGQKVMFVFTGRDGSSTPEEIQTYYENMLSYCGLSEQE